MDIEKFDKIDAMRMRDIVSQLTDIIYLLCDAKDKNIDLILTQFTNLTADEQVCLNLIYSDEILKANNCFSEI